MFGERHDLPHEFPEYQGLIKDLLQSDLHFVSLYKEYDALDEEILKIEQNVEPVSDAYAEELKLKRVHLKDKLYQLLQSRAAKMA
ncbi:MAG: YdcH family protein [Thiotrichales bacterium]